MDSDSSSGPTTTLPDGLFCPITLPPAPQQACSSSPSHCQAKRPRRTPCCDHAQLQNPVIEQGGVLTGEGLQSVPDDSLLLQEFTSMPTNVKDGHLSDSSIIQSRYTEAEMAAEPLLGVANWLNCPPSALRMPSGALSSPAPKYHAHNVQDSVPVLNKALSGAEVPHGGQGKPNSSDSILFVWDLDETLIIFQTLSNGKFAELFQGSKDPRVGSELGRRWESLILDVCDDYFFYKQEFIEASRLHIHLRKARSKRSVEDYNEPNLMSLQDFDDGADLSLYDFDMDHLTVPVDAANKRKLAYRHRYIADLYSKGLKKLLSHDQMTEWQSLYAATDRYTDGWLTAGRELLDECERTNQRLNKQGSSTGSSKTTDCDPILTANTFVSHYNILVTSGTLVPSLVKCMLFRLDKYFHHFNIYSSREVGKLQCFQWVKERVERLPLKFCVIGDGIDEGEAAHVLTWPFVKINIGPYAIHRLPTMSMDILDHYIKVIYDPTDKSQAIT